MTWSTSIPRSLFDVVVGQAKTQVSAHRDDNDIRWEAEAGKGRTSQRAQGEGGGFSYWQSRCQDRVAAECKRAVIRIATGRPDGNTVCLSALVLMSIAVQLVLLWLS